MHGALASSNSTVKRENNGECYELQYSYSILTVPRCSLIAARASALKYLTSASSSLDSFSSNGTMSDSTRLHVLFACGAG